MIVVEVTLRQLDGTRVAILSDFEALHVHTGRSRLGGVAWQVGGEPRALDLYEMLEPDMLMEVRWRDDAAGIAPRVEAQALLLDRHLWRDDTGWHLQAVGADLGHLLQRTMCYAEANTAAAIKSGATETVIKAFVTQEVMRAGHPDLTVAADAAGGAAITVNGFNKSLLEICQTAHHQNGGDYTMVADANADVVFDWVPGGLGTDRRTTTRFGLSYGNVTNPSLTHKRSAQVSHVLVMGQGEGADRERVLVVDAVLAAESKWGRIERTRDARDVPEGDTTQLIARGAEVLNQNATLRRWDFEVLQTEGTRYGRDYFLGDLVRAELGRDWVDRVIGGVALTLGNDMPPTFEIKTEDLV